MRHLPPIAFLLLLSVSALAQSPIWTDAYNASKSGATATTDFTVDNSGNAYHCGNFTGTANFDTFKLVANSQDGYVVKTTSAGKVEWAVKLGDTNQDQAVGVAVDVDGNVYVTGTFLGKFEVQDSSYTAVGSFDSYLVKLNDKGKVQWVSIATGNSLQTATDVAVDESKNVYWFGQYFGSSTIAGRSLAQAGGSYDLFLAKISSKGKPIRVKGYGGSSTELAKLITTNGKHILFTAQYFGSFSIGSTSISSSGSYDVAMVKMDTSFSLGWMNSAGGNSIDDVHSISLTSKGAAAIAGTFVSNFSIGSKSVSGSWYDIYVAMVSTTGSGIWVNKISTTGFGQNSFIRGLKAFEDGSVTGAGYHGSSIAIGSSTYNPNGSSDAIVVNYNKNGAFKWINRGGNSGAETVFGMGVDSIGYYYVGGYYGSSTKFGKTSLSGTGAHMNYVAKGTPPITAPDFKKLRNQYVYVDSTFEKSYDLNLSSPVTYRLIKGPSGAQFDKGDATITYKPNADDKGRHRVVLEAENLGGKDRDSFFIEVITPLSAHFNLPDTGCVGVDYTFEPSDSSLGPLVAIWDFGDGESAIESNTVHSFDSVGTYIVHLYASNVFKVTDSMIDTITIMPRPDVSFAIQRACIKDTMKLVNNSSIATGSIVAYEWKENGTLVGNSQDFSRYQDSATVYNYELIAISNAGCSDTTTDFVRITAKPTAGFLAYNACVSDDALFFDASLAPNDTIITYNWDFGDGNTETLGFPGISHKYTTAGDFTASLTTITRNGCSDTYFANVTVNVKPVSNFKAHDLCLGQELELRDLSTTPKGIIIQRRWTTGDGKSSNKANFNHTYKAPGKYKIDLVTVNSLGCADTLQTLITVTQKSVAGFVNTLPCEQQNAIFQDTSKVGANDTQLPTKWYVDGSLESTGSLFIKSVGSSTIKVQMVVTTQAGCYDSIEKVLTPKPPVVADFGLSPACEGDTQLIVQTLDTSMLDSTQWVGNGIDVFEENDQFYAVFSDYQVEGKLFLRTYAENGCQDSTAKSVAIYPKPSTHFVYDLDSMTNKATFNSKATGSNTYTWIFGNGDTTVTTSRTVSNSSYYVNQFYTVKLGIVSDKGCTSFTDSTIYIGFPNSVDESLMETISLYPNPAREHLNLNIPVSIDWEGYTISDLSGKTVLQGSMRQIDVSMLPAGAYTIALRANGSVVVSRFMKQ